MLERDVEELGSIKGRGLVVFDEKSGCFFLGEFARDKKKKFSREMLDLTLKHSEQAFKDCALQSLAPNFRNGDIDQEMKLSFDLDQRMSQIESNRQEEMPFYVLDALVFPTDQLRCEDEAYLWDHILSGYPQLFDSLVEFSNLSEEINVDDPDEWLQSGFFGYEKGDSICLKLNLVAIEKLQEFIKHSSAGARFWKNGRLIRKSSDNVVEGETITAEEWLDMKTGELWVQLSDLIGKISSVYSRVKHGIPLEGRCEACPDLHYQVR